MRAQVTAQTAAENQKTLLAAKNQKQIFNWNLQKNPTACIIILVYNSVWTTSANGQELALCFGGADPAWKLMTLISSAYEFIYAAGDYADSTSNLNTDGTVLLTVTQCNPQAFDGKTLSSGEAVIKGNKCTLTLN